jgi:RNA polymerase sigma factor (sigma-70 family)
VSFFDPTCIGQANTTRASQASLLDREQLVAFREGKRDVLEQVYREHVAAVARFVRRGFMYKSQTTTMRFAGARDAFELEALVQEVFTRAFEPRTRLAYDGLRPYGAFLNGIAKNIILDRLRKDARHGEVLTAPDELDRVTGAEPVVSADEQHGRGLVATFLASSCSDRDRALYALRYERDLSQTDAATEARLTRIQVRRWEADFRERLLRFLKRCDYVRDP